METYLIRLRGLVNVEELNPMSPHHMTSIQAETSATWFSICTDQSGMIGQVRHLHNQGLIILSISCQTQETTELIERSY